jgi:hypothetical protein
MAATRVVGEGVRGWGRGVGGGGGGSSGGGCGERERERESGEEESPRSGGREVCWGSQTSRRNFDPLAKKFFYYSS